MGAMANARPRRRVPSLPALGGAIGAVAVDALYLAAIVQQGAVMPGGRVPFVAAWIAVAACLAGIGALTQAATSRALLLAGTPPRDWCSRAPTGADPTSDRRGSSWGDR